ncbi:hypothetical protein D047_0366B, partial [Vibrio parahaemolyticus VPTS-2010_2]
GYHVVFFVQMECTVTCHFILLRDETIFRYREETSTRYTQIHWVVGVNA